MTSVQKALLELSRQALTPGCQKTEICSSVNWGDLFGLACGTSMEGVVYDSVVHLPQKQQPPRALLDEWKKRVIIKTGRQVRRNQWSARLLAILQEKGIPFLVFKGPTLSSLYPTPNVRFASDLDILLAREYQQAAESVFEELGMVFSPEHSKKNVLSWQYKNEFLVEMHFRLWEDYTDDRVQLLEAMNLTAPDTLTGCSVLGLNAVTLGPTQHLIYQMFHIVKHMFYRGMKLRLFVDITLFANRYLNDIDWALFWDSMERLHYASFCDAMFRACARYYNLNRRALSPARMDNALNIDAFMADIFNLQTHGRVGAAWSVVLPVMTNYFHRSDKIKNLFPRAQLFFRIVFPTPSLLAPRYHYARRNPFLLPVAWLHRQLDWIKHRELRYQAGILRKAIVLADQKFTMLKNFELTD